jgi:hypothetical protein
MDRIRKPKWERRRQCFALDYDRRAESNVPYTDPGLHRIWRGKAPLATEGPQNLSTRAPQPLDSAQHLWTNPAQIYTVPEGYIGTASGIVAVTGTIMVPDEQQGYPTDSPCDITDDWDSSNVDGCEYFHQRFPKPEEQFYNKDYTVANPDGSLTRIVWENVDYTSPTYPQTRMPTGGFRRRDNKYV